MANFEINFGNIPPDLEPDENITLWRYMSFSSLCEILMNDCIPLIGIHKFSDKSEGSILKAILSKIHINQEGIQYAMRKYYETTYISSWHEAESENAAMWDRYTYGGEGVAIKTNAKLLLDCIGSVKGNNMTDHQFFSELRLDALPKDTNIIPNNSPDIIIKRVKYTDKNPADFAMGEKYLHNGYDKLCFFYKLDDFEDESEVRILRSSFHSAYIFATADGSDFSKVEDTFKKIRPLKDAMLLEIDSAGKLIQQIVVSPYAHDAFIQTVQQSIGCINRAREKLRVDLIECDVIESRRKEWV